MQESKQENVRTGESQERRKLKKDNKSEARRKLERKSDKLATERESKKQCESIRYVNRMLSP